MPGSSEDRDTETVQRGHGAERLEILVSGPAGTLVYPLHGRSRVQVGRSSKCEIALPDPSLSRVHAILSFGDEMTVEDTGSHNGTRLDGQPIEARRGVSLRVGSIVEVGSTTLVLRKAVAQAPAVEGLVLADPQMRELYRLLDDVGPSPLNVLVLGETGVGKEHYASAVHQKSKRREAAYLQVNCAALHAQLLEAELFGYERGAFTGATHAKPGLFEAASGGSVFLDEVGEMDAATQAKLLRVLQDGSVQRLGSVKPMRVDVRVISATNRDLRAAVERGEFRADLFFRLNGMSVTLPPLRKRRADVAPLAELFARSLTSALGRPPVAFDASALHALETHPFPGNVRELKNVVERTVLLFKGTTLSAADLRFDDDLSDRPTVTDLSEVASPTMHGDVERLERQLVVDAMAKTGGNQSKAAKLLGVSRNTLIARLEKFGLARPRKI